MKIKCSKARDFILLAATGELPARESRLLEEHLAVCKSCRSYREQIAATARAAEYLPETPAGDVVARVLAAARSDTRRGHGLIMPLPVRVFAVAATLLILAGSAAFLALHRRIPATPASVAAVPAGKEIDAELDALESMLAMVSEELVAPAEDTAGQNYDSDEIAKELLQLEGS